ncbi:MAG: GntR family transcriptional regulator, partial [Mangrovicoccus sp.]|nr:GntR family transcriptional regulator [Mangrovicoccus sp.]
MKGNAVFKRSYNRCLDLLSGVEIGAPIGSEIALSQELEVSRTTLRTVQDALQAAGIIGSERRRRCLLRHPVAADYFAGTEAVPAAELAERQFLRWMLGPDCRPGQIVNGLDLARQFGVSNSAIRDCLNRFAHLGLLERQTSGRWQALGLDRNFVAELFDMREIIEVRSVMKFVALPDSHPAWARLEELARDHLALAREIPTRFTEFPELDDRFHMLVGSITSNR